MSDNQNGLSEVVIEKSHKLRSSVEGLCRDLKISPTLCDVLLIPFDFTVLLFCLCLDAAVTIWVKIEICLGLLYIVSPADIIPDNLPGIGLIDDIVIACIILNRILNATKKADLVLVRRYWLGSANNLSLIKGVFIIFDKWFVRFITLSALYKIISSLIAS